MTPIDYRNETFEMVRERGLVCERLSVYDAFRKHGPGTTREVARRAGIDILNLRPRATELYQLGFLKLLGDVPGNEGIYRALTIEEARAQFFLEQKRASAPGFQTQLQL